MKMDKIGLGIVSGILVMSLGACGGTSTSTSNETKVVDAPTQVVDTPAQVTVAEPTTTDSKYEVAIVDGQLVTDYEGNPAFAVLMTFTNNSEENATFTYTFNVKAFQNGVEQDIPILMGLPDEIQKAYDLSFQEIRPGTTVTVAKIMKLEDTTSPVDVEVSEMFDFVGKGPIATQTFQF